MAALCEINGHDSRAIVDGGVYEHKTITILRHLLGWSPKTSKIVKLDRGSTLLVGLGCLCLVLASLRRHIKFKN